MTQAVVELLMMFVTFESTPNDEMVTLSILRFTCLNTGICLGPAISSVVLAALDGQSM